MNRNLTLALFALLVIAQLAVPVSMIVGSERTLTLGILYKFRTAPVDPYDAFRGRYVDLNYDAAIFEVGVTHNFEEGDTAYALIVEDGDGFAMFYDLLPQRPAVGDYLRVHIAANRGTSIALRLPFDRYYMPEDLAPLVERVLRERTRATQNDAYVTVRILDGEAQLEELYIGNQTIRQFLQQNPE